jgi:hypothetical protein
MVSTSRLSATSARLLFTLLASAVLLGSGEASGAQLTASWVDNSNSVATTRIERRLGTDATYVAIADAPPGTTTFVDASVSQGATYCYRAFAYDADAVSPYTDESCATSPYDGVTVNVGKAGNGTGTVISTPAGIYCGTACAASYTVGSAITLAATPDPGATFNGWSGGGCVGTAPCTFASNTSVAVTASFSPASYTLTVAKSGPGTVTSTPSGINCGSDCSGTYTSGTMVTLIATLSNNGSAFVGWSGGSCSGTTPTCVVSVKAATSVTATFKNGKGK